MKKTTLLLLLLCAIPVAAPWEGGHQEIGGAAVTGTAYLISQMGTDFSDLDVRDAHGRPVTNPSAKAELESLFRENLLDLMVLEAPHTVAETQNWLNQFSHLFNKLVLARMAVIIGLFQDAFLPPQRRFVHNVHNLCTTFFVAAPAHFSLSAVRPTITSSTLLILRL
jgi:hypothetical protein